MYHQANNTSGTPAHAFAPIYSHGPSNQDARQQYSTAGYTHVFQPSHYSFAPAPRYFFAQPPMHAPGMSPRALQSGLHPTEHISSYPTPSPRMQQLQPVTQSLGIALQHSDPTGLRHGLLSDFCAPTALKKSYKSVSLTRKSLRDLSPLARQEKTRFSQTRSFSKRDRMASGRSASRTGRNEDKHLFAAMDSLKSDATKTLTAFGLSSRFKHFCSSMMTNRQLRSDRRRLQR